MDVWSDSEALTPVIKWAPGRVAQWIAYRSDWWLGGSEFDTRSMQTFFPVISWLTGKYMFLWKAWHWTHSVTHSVTGVRNINTKFLKRHFIPLGITTSIDQKTYIAFNPFPNKPWFLRVCSTGLLKTLWETGKLLVTSNFSFSHGVFFPFRELFAIFIQFQNYSLQTLSVWKSLKFIVWERVNPLPHNPESWWPV